MAAGPADSNDSRRIRVAVAEQHSMLRVGLVRLVSECGGVALVAQAADGRTALAQIRALRPEIAVVGHDLPGLDGPGVAGAARREQLPSRVLVLVDARDGGGVLDAVRAGAAGCLTRDSEWPELAAALRALAAGATVLAPDIVTCLAHEIRLQRRLDRPTLAAREREILALVADDCSTREIATRMHLSAATVKSYLQRAYQKLDVTDRASAVARALRLGLVE